MTKRNFKAMALALVFAIVGVSFYPSSANAGEWTAWVKKPHPTREGRVIVYSWHSKNTTRGVVIRNAHKYCGGGCTFVTADRGCNHLRMKDGSITKAKCRK